MKRPRSLESSTPLVKRHTTISNASVVVQLKKVRMRTRHKKTRRVVVDGPATPENLKWTTTVCKNDIFESRYRVEEVLGSGSQGVVCRATDLSDNNAEVAIKWIRLPTKDDAVRTLREIRIMKVLGVHSDLLRLKRVMMSKDMHHVLLVMDLMEADLRKVLDLNILHSMHRRVFMYQLLRGLAFMHDSGVLHRDLKPQNILVNADCTVRIADFGISRYGFDDKNASSATSTSDTDSIQWTDYVVTRWYRAPELCGLFYKDYGAAVDAWSIGCIFAELLIGSPLFLGRDSEHQLKVITDLLGKPSEECIRKIENPRAREWLRDLPPKPDKLRQTLDELGVHDKHALDLLTKLLAFDPAERLSARDALTHPYLQDIHDTICCVRDWTHEASLAKECFRRLREPSADQAAETLRSEFGGSKTRNVFDEERDLRAQIELLASKKSRSSASYRPTTTEHLVPATRTPAFTRHPE